MKKIRVLLAALAVLFTISACVLNSVGLYSAEQYNSVSTSEAQARATADYWQEQSQYFEGQVDVLQEAIQANDTSTIRRLICTKTWEEMRNIGVWDLSDQVGSTALADDEHDLQVDIYLTQWLPAGTSDSTGSYLLVIDWFHGIALYQGEGCLIVDPAKWSIPEI